MLTRTNIQRLARAEQGVALWGCTPGSPAALAGLRYGDIVLSVNGQRIRTPEEYVAAKVEDKDHVVEFRRGADVLTTTISPGPAVWPDLADEMSQILGRGSFWARRSIHTPDFRN